MPFITAILIFHWVPGVKYCPLLEKENGIPALESVVLNKNISSEVRELAEQVLERCDHFHRDPKYLSDIEDMDAN